MIFNTIYNRIIVKIISILFIVLFVYAAVSKILDYETFRVQLAQSPLLSAYAGIIAWCIPVIEIGISFLLMVPKFRTIAIYAAFTLMVMFTAYIYIILNYSDFIPCSCGGVLEKLSWTQHLIFNLVFIMLAGVAVFFTVQINNKKTLLMLTTLAIIGIGVVALLFVFSEKEIKRNSAFIRRYPPNAAVEKASFDLGVNSYYIIGVFDDRIYLGNYTAPLYVKVLNTSLKNIADYQIQLQDTMLPFRRIEIEILPPYFFVADGTVPRVYRGNINDWKVQKLIANDIYFNSLVVMDTLQFGIRTESSETGENIIATINPFSHNPLHIARDLLEKQYDGIFDTDGQLLWNEKMERLIYVYFYRNHFLLINDSLQLDMEGRTIDTVTKPKLNIVSIESKGQTKLGAPPIFINKTAATSDKYLYINSERLGRYEAEEMLKQATMVDVYDLGKMEYQYSFYIYYYKKNKLKSFIVHDKQLYAIMDKYLVSYDLNR